MFNKPRKPANVVWRMICDNTKGARPRNTVGLRGREKKGSQCFSSLIPHHDRKLQHKAAAVSPKEQRANRHQQVEILGSQEVPL